MLLAVIDIETGGEFGVLDAENFIVELAIVGYDTELQSIVFIHNVILNNEKPISVDSTAVHGITNAFVEQYGIIPTFDNLVDICVYLDNADAIVAHNGLGYDKPIMESYFASKGLALPEKLWIDTTQHLDFPPDVKYTNLTYLAGYYGIVNQFSHRAVFDVFTTLKVLTNFEINKVVANARRKMHVVKAIVSYDDKDKAKALQFKWENVGKYNYPKSWIKIVNEDELNNFPFKIEILHDIN